MYLKNQRSENDHLGFFQTDLACKSSILVCSLKNDFFQSLFVLILKNTSLNYVERKITIFE